LHTETTGTGTAAGDNTAIFVQSQASGRDCNIRFGDSINASARIGYLSNSLYFYVNGNERGRWDSSGRFLVGTSTAYGTGNLQVFGSSNTGTYTNNAFSSNHVFIKSRSTAAGGFTVVQSDDELGGITFQGTDGSANVSGARIFAAVDGTPGTNSMPGRIVLSTTASGASSPTERMRIKSNGTINFSNVATYADNAAATTGGLAVGDVYRTSTGQLMIRY
jgi:hypothetical protein